MTEISEVPTISITQENDDVEEPLSDCPSDIDIDIKGTHTDIENLASNDEGTVHANMIQNFKKTYKKTPSPSVTDIEEYDASDSEENDDKSEAKPEIKLPLNEFLNFGYTEEKTQIANKLTSRSDSMIKEGKFISSIIFTEDDPGCVTDCENYNTSGDDIPDDLIINNHENINIKTEVNPETEANIQITDECTKDDKSSQTALSDIEDEEGAWGLCTLGNNILNGPTGGNVSEIEDIYLSGDEEIVQFEGSDSENESEISYPAIDVTFIPTEKRSYNKNESSHKIDEPLTDVEKLSSSDSEANAEEDQPIIPTAQASILSLTDVEDVDIGEATELLAEMQQIRDVNIPPPVREIYITKEDENGVPITNVMPLQENINLGIHNNYSDKGLTDTEEISCNEEDICETINPIIVSSFSTEHSLNSNIIQEFAESANIQNCESIKCINQRKLDIDQEPVTDVEEIFLAGTVRRRKNKSKNPNKSKSKYLDIKHNVKESITDTEEFYISDIDNTSRDLLKKCNNNEGARALSPELKTDIEYISGDGGEDGDVSEDDKRSEINIPGQEIYFSTVSSIESLTRQGESIQRKPSPPVIRVKEDDCCGAISKQCLTDIEDVQLQSDVENFYETYSRADTVSPGELQEILNEGGMSVIHEKCGKVFNVDDEKQHIKGMNNCNEAITDIEYLEEELITDKKQSIKFKTEGN